MMTKSTICWVLFLGFLSARGQDNILKLSPNKHYKLYFVYVRFLETGTERVDTIRSKFTITWDNDKSFLVEDNATIDKLQRDWRGKASDNIYECWYDYFLYLVEDGKIIDEIRVNEECKQVVCEHGVFDYSTPILESLSKNKLISVARVRFDSLSTGRHFIKDARANSEIYAPVGEYDEWIKYDGRATITTKSGSDKRSQAKITKQIKKFTDSDFLTQLTGGGPGYSLYDIYCNEQLGKNLTDFEVFMKWRPIEPGGILLISNSQTPINNLVKKYGR
ncbi:MAG: hypothetical protein IM631_18560 [Cytophagales bacterium]|nr:hypothetical protein [Cytophagales bacterium]MCA6373373.1 hypothetical protein [Cytophagales bacterium]MCA6377365.1 hypothetical protein [Cytophagales bacterium]MCA6386009.1 hypothetical protein [Cytophagales bacterium]